MNCGSYLEPCWALSDKVQQLEKTLIRCEINVRVMGAYTNKKYNKQEWPVFYNLGLQRVKQFSIHKILVLSVNEKIKRTSVFSGRCTSSVKLSTVPDKSLRSFLEYQSLSFKTFQRSKHQGHLEWKGLTSSPSFGRKWYVPVADIVYT